MLIDGVKVTTDFNCTIEELKPYVAYVKTRAANVVVVRLHKIHSGLIAMEYVADGEPLPNLFSVSGYFATERGCEKYSMRY